MDEADQEYMLARFDDVMEFRTSLLGETDRGRALMAAEYLSNQLGELLRASFVDDAEISAAVLNDPNRSLGTFSSRIDLAYLLGLIGPTARREFHLVRKIRNEFAHDYKPLTFDADAIANQCRKLRAHVLVPEERPRAHFTRSVVGLLAVIHAHVTKHAAVGTDVLSKFSDKELRAIVDDIKKIVEELMKAPGLPEQIAEQ